MPVITTQLGAFLPMVLPHLSGVPEPTAVFNLRMAAIEFCERTRCWRHITSQDLEENDEILVAPYYAAIHEFEYALFDNVPLTPVQFSDVEHGTISNAEGSPPKFVTQKTPNTVSVYPFTPGTLEVSLFLKPRYGNEFGGNPDNPLEDAYDEVPEFLLTQHGEPIAHGALARIFAIPNQPFSNPNLAAFYLQRFKNAMEGKFAANLKGQQKAPLRTRYNDF